MGKGQVQGWGDGVKSTMQERWIGVRNGFKNGNRWGWVGSRPHPSHSPQVDQVSTIFPGRPVGRPEGVGGKDEGIAGWVHEVDKRRVQGRAEGGWGGEVKIDA